MAVHTVCVPNSCPNQSLNDNCHVETLYYELACTYRRDSKLTWFNYSCLIACLIDSRGGDVRRAPRWRIDHQDDASCIIRCYPQSFYTHTVSHLSVNYHPSAGLKSVATSTRQKAAQRISTSVNYGRLLRRVQFSAASHPHNTHRARGCYFVRWAMITLV